MLRRIIILGAGLGGQELGIRLKEKYQVILLDLNPVPSEAYLLLHNPDMVQEMDQNGLGTWFYQADGSSRLVLKSLFREHLHCSLVAMTGNDEFNLEAATLAKLIGYSFVMAVENDQVFSSAYAENHILTVSRSKVIVDYIEQTLSLKGAVIPSNIGLGKGEIIEVQLLKTSPVVRRPLKELAPQKWRIAAVFRQDSLVVPTGDTVLEVDDRVLLIGDPEILPSVVNYLSRGSPQFPQPYGVNILTLEEENEKPELLQEADFLIEVTAARKIVRMKKEQISKSAPPLRGKITAPPPQGPAKPTFSEILPLDHLRFDETVRVHQPGLILIKPHKMGFFLRLLGQRARDRQLCDLVLAPVLFCRSSHPYQRILLPISGSKLDREGTELAIDLARQLKVKLFVFNSDLPELISGLHDDELHVELPPVKRLCELYDQPFQYLHREGNSIREIVKEAQKDDLIILSRWQGRPDTYFNPDVALRVARHAPCSVLVITSNRKD